MQRRVLVFFAIFASLVMHGSATTQTQRTVASGQAAAMADSASAFLETLTSDQHAKIIRRFDDDAARMNWSIWPPSSEHEGLLIAVLTPPQRIAFHEMLMSAMSSQGYAKSAAVMWLDDSACRGIRDAR